MAVVRVGHFYPRQILAVKFVFLYEMGEGGGVRIYMQVLHF